MSSQLKAAPARKASEIDEKSIQPQGGTNAPGSSMNVAFVQVTEPHVRHLRDCDVFQEQRPTEPDAMHSIPQGDAKSNQQKFSSAPSEFSTPRDNDMPKWEGDPYEYILKPMLRKDTDQCAAWKDEVQNTLIFAGLFSAVVTPFIIESYQRLRPDSNDVLVGLLAHIATRLDNAPNNTQAVSSIITNTVFSPSRSDISINIFWFISLVLSLTTALIGIVTLQWLREHQRYDMTHKSQERLAILNARRHSLEQWYVPQIFAGLPLLLQAALVLFFGGVIQFLFALRLEVAVPVTLSICVPLIFLIMTTILPLLQVCILQDAFRLSINNNIPSPCPYKSPQSLIARRFVLSSRTVFTIITSMVAGAYVCIIKMICILQKLTGRHPPAFHSDKPYLKLRLCDEFPRVIGDIFGPAGEPPGDWVSIDATWMRARTIYALSLQMMHRDDSDLVVPRRPHWDPSKLPAELYDCTSCFQEVARQNEANADLFNSLYSCITTLCSQTMEHLQTTRLLSGDTMFTDLCFAFGGFICDGSNMTASPISVAFIADVIPHRNSRDAAAGYKTLSIAFNMSWVGAISDIWHNGTHTELARDTLITQLVTKRLELGPERSFSMSTAETWLPSRFLIYFGTEHFSPLVVTNLFHTFLEGCSRMQPHPQLRIRPGPARQAYKTISAYMEVNVRITPINRTVENLAHVTLLCNVSPQDLIQDKPFLLIAACFYLDAIIKAVKVEDYTPLVGAIANACGTTDGRYGYEGWTGLNDAINAIYRHHNEMPGVIR